MEEDILRGVVRVVRQNNMKTLIEYGSIVLTVALLVGVYLIAN